MRVRVLVALLVAVTVAAHAGTVRPGDEAPSFTLRDGQGEPVSLTALHGKVVCVQFWATWCTACRSALPVIDDLARQLAADDVVALAVNIDQDRSAVDRYLAAHLPAPALRVLYDPGGDLLARFGAASMPALYLVDRRGVVRLVETREDAVRMRLDLEGRLRALIAEPAP